MAGMEKWFHCNYCQSKPTAKNNLYLITTCTHIFCKKCEKKANPVCAICQRKCSYHWIDDKLNPDLKNYFKPYEDLEKKALEALQRARDIRKFQLKHANLMRMAEKKKAEKTDKMFKDAILSIQKLKKENLKWKEFASQASGGQRMRISSPGPGMASHHHTPRSGTPMHLSSSGSAPKSRRISPAMSVPGTPRNSTQADMARMAAVQHSAMPSDFQRRKRLSLVSPPVDGKIVSPKDTEMQQRQMMMQHQHMGVAGQMASYKRSPFNMMNVNASPIQSVPGTFQGQAVVSPYTPKTGELRNQQKQRLMMQQWQQQQQGLSSSTPICSAVQSATNSPFAFPNLHQR